MAGQAEHEQLAISARDLRFYAFQSLGGGHSITDMVQMINRGFPFGKVIRSTAEYEIPEALLQKTLHISPAPFDGENTAAVSPPANRTGLSGSWVYTVWPKTS